MSYIEKIRYLRDNVIVLKILLLGVLGGLSFFVLYTAIVACLKDQNIALGIATGLATARMPYSLKVFWAPLVDLIKIPFLHNTLGKRSSWMVLCCFFSSLLVLYLGNIATSGGNLEFGDIYIVCLAIGVIGATYDIACDAFRIDVLLESQQGYGSSTAALGYRLGGLIINAGMLFASEMYGWRTAFYIVAGLFALGIPLIISVGERKYFPLSIEEKDVKVTKKVPLFTLWRTKIWDAVINPMVDLFKRVEYAPLFLLAVVLYKVGDAMLSFVSTPFFMELHYTKITIAKIVKIFGWIALSFGNVFGGYIATRYGNIRGLIICGVIHSASHLIYMWLYHYTNRGEFQDETALMLTIFVENFTGGMNSVGMIVIFSAMCNKNYSATQYALLSSLATLANNYVTQYAGSLIETIGWDAFFVFVVVVAIPSLLIFAYIDYKHSAKQRSLRLSNVEISTVTG